MVATVSLCFFSTLSFCLCARGLLLALGDDGRRFGDIAKWQDSGGFSGRARRLARGYVQFALSVLAIASMIGAVKSYLELFGY